MKRNTFFSFLFFCCFAVFGQTNQKQLIDSILLAFKSYELDKAKPLIDRLEDEMLQKVFRSYWNFNKYGDFDGEILELKTAETFPRTSAIQSFVKAEYYKNSNQKKDAVRIYENYLKSLKEAIHTQDTVLATTIFPKILKHLYYLHRTNFDEFKKYSELYQLYQKDAIDRYWFYYYTIVVKLAAYEGKRAFVNLQDLDFNQLHQLATNDLYLQAETHQLEGIYYDHFVKNFDEADIHFDKAIILYSKNDFYAAQRRISGNKLNLAIPLFNEKKYKEAIPYFKKSLQNSIVEKKLLEEFQSNEWLYKCYDSLQVADSALFFLREMNIAKDRLKKENYALEVAKIEKQYDFDEKEAELKTRSDSLQSNMNILIPVLGFIILVLIFTFYLYKRYKSKSKNLETEKSETLEKIEELKGIVVKNHIVLKDKTKVYVADLMYVKSEDHFIKLFLSNGKSHFVRGKISQIAEELPPNFIRSHRSYILNANFIKQINANHIILLDKTEIPLSRSHKNNFKDKP